MRRVICGGKKIHVSLCSTLNGHTAQEQKQPIEEKESPTQPPCQSPLVYHGLEVLFKLHYCIVYSLPHMFSLTLWCDV